MRNGTRNTGNPTEIARTGLGYKWTVYFNFWGTKYILLRNWCNGAAWLKHWPSGYVINYHSHTETKNKVHLSIPRTFHAQFRTYMFKTKAFASSGAHTKFTNDSSGSWIYFQPWKSSTKAQTFCCCRRNNPEFQGNKSRYIACTPFRTSLRQIKLYIIVTSIAQTSLQFDEMYIEKDLATFYTTCIRPITEYACPVFHNGLPRYLSDYLKRIQKRTLRIIFPQSSYVEALELCSLPSLYDRRESLTTKLLKKYVVIRTTSYIIYCLNSIDPLLT